MVEPAEHPHLTAECRLALGGRLRAGQHLDGHLPAHHGVLRPKYLPHAPPSHLVENGVLAEAKPPPAGQDLAGLKGREQFVLHEPVGHGLIPLRGRGDRLVEHLRGRRLGRGYLRLIQQAARQRRFPEAGPLTTGLFGRSAHRNLSLPMRASERPRRRAPECLAQRACFPGNRLGNAASQPVPRGVANDRPAPVAGWTSDSPTAWRAIPPGSGKGRRLP